MKPMQNCMKRKCLSKCFGEEFSEEDKNDDEISSNSLKLDIMFDCVCFLDKQGLMEKDMEVFVNFFNGIFTDTVCKGIPIEDAVNIVKRRLTTFFRDGRFSTLFARSAIDYLMSTILQHYHLMEFVMNNPREEELHMLVENIDVPPQPEMLNVATSASVWETQTRIGKKEAELESKKKELEDRYGMLKSKLSEEIESYMASVTDMQLDANSIIELTSAILHKYADVTATELQSLMESSKEMMTFKIEKAKILTDVKKKGVR